MFQYACDNFDFMISFIMSSIHFVVYFGVSLVETQQLFYFLGLHFTQVLQSLVRACKTWRHGLFGNNIRLTWCGISEAVSVFCETVMHNIK